LRRGVVVIWRAIRALLVLALLAIASFVSADLEVSSHADRVFAVADVPPHDLALVLGTAPKVSGGRRNLHFEGRMDLAADLLRRGKVKRLLLSGDNGTRGYDEPTAMKTALIARGVSEDALVLDYAGFRTLDSVARAKSTFGHAKLIVVTDDFHIARALYLCEHFGIEAVGCAADTSEFLRPGIRVREHFARALAVADVVTGRKPKFER
jgi:SanA protein